MTEHKQTTETAKKAVGTRGRTFKGIVIKKFPMRVVIEIERTIYVPKYESFYRKKSKIHSRLLGDIDVNVGDIVLVRECRPLSKIIHSVVVKKVSGGENESN